MDLSLIADTFTIATNNHGLISTRFTTAEFLKISAAISPVDALAPPRVRPKRKTISRNLLRKQRRTRKRHAGGDDDEDGGFFSGDGDFNGPFGGGYGGDSGRWNFGGNNNWNNGDDDDDEFSSNSWSAPAFNFVYEVICWIALSNCVHFAFKKTVRILTNGDREKVMPMRLNPVC
ncbi:hypothetical protein ACFE04_011931 [Oxalis oulophora]